jgi:hypothetical protein
MKKVFVLSALIPALLPTTLCYSMDERSRIQKIEKTGKHHA